MTSGYSTDGFAVGAFVFVQIDDDADVIAIGDLVLTRADDDAAPTIGDPVLTRDDRVAVGDLVRFRMVGMTN
jgi:hypothetical protein